MKIECDPDRNEVWMMKILKVLICLIIVACMTAGSAICETGVLHQEYMTEAMIENNLTPADTDTLCWTIDSAGKGTLPSNYRSMLIDAEEFAERNEKLRYNCTCEGLAEVRMSGSAEFNEAQLAAMIEVIRSGAGNDVNIVVVDMRQECHLLINGISASLKDPKHNFSNVGMSTGEVMQKETELANEILNTDIRMQIAAGKNKTIETVHADSVMTEKELCEKYGIGYLRLASTDHIMVPNVNIDAFIESAKQLPENSWLHFHCAAGRGRTGVMMCLYDMMMNPELSASEISERQEVMGSENPLNTAGNLGKWNDAYKQEKAETMALLYQYVKDNHDTNYHMPWSEYHTQHM